MKNRHWLEFTEYASIAGVATGAVASFFAKQVLYVSTPLSIALLVGFANRRRVERLNDEKTTTSIATLKRKLSKQIKLMDQHIQTLPTPEMVGDVRNSTLRHSRDELKQLTTKIQAMQEVMGQYASILDEQNSGGIRDEIRQLQGFYTEIYGTLNQLQKTFNGLDVENKKKDVENLVTQLRGEAEQLQSRFQSLTDQTQPILSYLQEQVNHLNRQNSAILQQVDANSIKRELDILMDAVADLAPKRELNTVMADVRTLQENQDAQGQAEESLRQQIQTVMQRLQAVPDVPQFRAQIEETLSWKLSDINKQLRSLPNTEQFQSRIKETLQTELETINLQLETHADAPPYKLIFDLHPHLEGRAKQPLPLSESQQILEDALSSTEQRLIMVWPWSVDMQMDKPLMRKLEQFVKQGRQLDIGWCHITSPGDERFLSVINRRWSLDPLHRRSLQRTLQYLLALKRRYPKNFKFRVLGAVENFLVSDRSFAVLGIENRLTPISASKDISLKLWTSDQAVIQQLIQTFEHNDLAPEDLESHWNRAMTRYDLGDRAGAMTDINQVLSVNPNYAAAYNMRGIIQWDEGDQEAAVADFDQSLSLDETQTTVYCNRGFIRSEQGDQYQAIADFSLAIQAENNYISLNVAPNATLGIAYFYRGLACQKLDDFEGAIADYSEALTHVASSPVIRYHRGITYQALSQYDNAITDLEEAVSLFKQQGSQTNTRRASRHLAQARKARAIEASKPSASTPESVPEIAADSTPATPTASESVPSNSPAPIESQSSLVSPVIDPFAPIPTNSPAPIESQSSPVSPVIDPFAPIPSLDEPSPSLDKSSEVDAEIPNERPAETHSSAAIPTFLFPDDSRSRPSSIQDMDAVSEADPEPPAPQNETLPVELQPDSATPPTPAPTVPSIDAVPQLASSVEPPSPPIPPQRPRRRSRTDLDKLVTSTLTNFFDEVDMEKLGTQTLDNFFAVVQDDPMMASAQQQPALDESSSSAASMSTDAPSAERFEDVFNASSITSDSDDEEQSQSLSQDSSDGLNTPNSLNLESVNDHSDLQVEQTDEDENDVEIEKLVTSTLTNFFKDLNPEEINAPSPDFFEEVSTQDISEETLVNFHRVMDDIPAASKATSAAEEEAQPELDVRVESQIPGQALAKPEYPNPDGQSLDMQQTETSSDAVSSEHASDASDAGMGNISEHEIESLISSGPSDFLEAIDTEEIGTQTLGNFMATFQDAFVPEDADLEATDLGEGTFALSEDNPAASIHTAEVFVPPGNNQISQAQPTVPEPSQLNGMGSPDTVDASDGLESEAQSSGHNGPSSPHPKPTQRQLTSNGLSVGTETMSNLMAAIAKEDLGTQTLRDFVAIMGEEKANAYQATLQATDTTRNEEETQEESLNGKTNTSEDELREDIVDPLPDLETSTADSPDQTSPQSVTLNNDKVVDPEEDSILFESLADFSDRF